MEWRPIVGYEGLYEVSEFGDVRLLIRRGGGKHPEDGLMKVRCSKAVYKIVNLRNVYGVRKTHKIHRLVTEAFIGEIIDGMQVNHKDCDKLNNHYSNLEIVTPKENTRHAKANGRRRILYGTEYKHAKLTEGKVREIRHRHADGGVTQREMAKEYGVSETAISDILRYKRWRHVK